MFDWIEKGRAKMAKSKQSGKIQQVNEAKSFF